MNVFLVPVFDEPHHVTAGTWPASCHKTCFCLSGVVLLVWLVGCGRSLLRLKTACPLASYLSPHSVGMCEHVLWATGNTGTHMFWPFTTAGTAKCVQRLNYCVTRAVHIYSKWPQAIVGGNRFSRQLVLISYYYSCRNCGQIFSKG